MYKKNVINKIFNFLLNKTNQMIEDNNVLVSRYTEVDMETEKDDEDIKNNNENNLNGKDLKDIKIIFLGESGSGKSSIIARYINGKFIFFYKDNLPPETQNTKVSINGQNFNLIIRDTTDGTKPKTLIKNKYFDSQGVIIVFDVTNQESFDKAKFWINHAKTNCPKDTVICILGNKIDLTNNIVIDMNKGKELAGDNLYFEVSALSGNNLSLAFKKFLEEIAKKEEEIEINKKEKGNNSKKEKVKILALDDEMLDMEEINNRRKISLENEAKKKKKKKCC